MALPPFKNARLVNGDQPLTKRWYVEFWVWDAQKDCLARKREYSVNQFKTRPQRLAHAKKTIEGINELLRKGYHVNRKTKKQQDLIEMVQVDRDYSVRKAFDYILPIIKTTKRAATFNSYNSVSGLFLAFCEQVGWDQWKMRSISKTDIISWLDYCQTNEESKVSNTTRNNYKSFISGVFTMMVERGVLLANPALGVKGVAEDQGGNIAYTLKQVETLKEAIQAKDKRLWLFITFMLYGFIRPAEIGRLQVKSIDLQKRTIYLPGSITKNRKARHVKISSSWMHYLLELNLESYPAHALIFGYGLATGTIALQKNYANKLHHDIARALGFGPEYTLYSWKHTGVVIHYKAGIDIKTLQAQIGHQSLQETDIYLKSLDLYRNTEIEDKSPVI